MGDFLVSTDGKKNKVYTTEWEMERASHLVCHNNWAERPFAVVKALAHLYPKMSLANLSSLAHARVNGTYRSPTIEANKLKRKRNKQTMESGGAVQTAHPAIQESVSRLCCVRECSLGAVVKMRRELRGKDTEASRMHVAEHRANALAEQERLASVRVARLNKHAETTLIATVEELKDTILELGVGQTMEVLKAQFNKRVIDLHCMYPVSVIPTEYRTKKATAGEYHKLKMSPSSGENDFSTSPGL
jgi:hypothetical protein